MEQTNGQLKTTSEVAARFNELAQQEKWFEIQDELFADDVKSIEAAKKPFVEDAAGKAAVRKKGETIVAGVKEVHRAYTSEPIVTGNHFAVCRETDITTHEGQRVQMNELMVYEVENGKIVLEQFFY